MKAIVSFVVEMADEQAGDDFQQACEAVRLTFAFNGMKASKARTELQRSSSKPPPKINSRGPMPGRPS